MKKPKPPTFVAAKVPEDLLKSLDRAAKTAGRSRSSELRMRLDHSLRHIPVLAPAAQ